ncbi:hypothetical protein PF005_g25118 [Phytophthora fragariae]|uniref:Uncharacterized protein n=1 Tax=Phytophthora fragariae TaxID=53985 RepID=A0A6A3RM70_9STRA|nr:hypothetical protein PF003_g20426 [Phytophthora fragariae]KAE8923318.1 hypothetical protein PF009_g26430 [Phytophthora fragariae]KAE8975562.1 hypothetical protein PF011_g24411 [Phytophthora fragariae]KAE9078569.1 hypothetical protein PF010_g23087 [Phytophthora fragariae]KAE9082488.1 hypothetical protein PF007_g22278 [Phytophthora fragariae]
MVVATFRTRRASAVLGWVTLGVAASTNELTPVVLRFVALTSTFTESCFSTLKCSISILRVIRSWLTC